MTTSVFPDLSESENENDDYFAIEKENVKTKRQKSDESDYIANMIGNAKIKTGPKSEASKNGESLEDLLTDEFIIEFLTEFFGNYKVNDVMNANSEENPPLLKEFIAELYDKIKTRKEKDQ